MRIVEIREQTVPIGSSIRNSAISYTTMTGSAVVIVSDKMVNGRPLVGLAFDSIGRYGHGGLMRERFIPRLLAADPEAYAGENGSIDPVKAWAVMMQDEKPGGHGERPGAVGMLDSALWDLAAKAEGLPLWRLLADRFCGGICDPVVPVYASGGHYTPDGNLGRLQDDIRVALDRGFTRMKIKVGGAPIPEDCRRIEAALAVLGRGDALAVDCNGTFPAEKALQYAHALSGYGLAWLEEPVEPLDYALHAEVCAAWAGPLGTGENIFSAIDTRNLLRHGGMRPAQDLIQVDVSLSYGIVEYLRLIDFMEEAGWSRRQCLPHAGHVLALNVVAGLGLGGHETAADPANLMGGFPAGLKVENGHIRVGDHPGVGIEAHAGLYPVFKDLLPG